MCALESAAGAEVVPQMERAKRRMEHRFVVAVWLGLSPNSAEEVGIVCGDVSVPGLGCT